MHSDERYWLGVWLTVCGAIVGVTALLVNFIPETEAVSKMRIQSEHILKRECIRNKGEWKYVKGTSDKACSFVREED